MIIDYKKELETAARNMILVHDTELLINMTVSMIVEKAKVNHASILAYRKPEDSYVLNISRGSLGAKIPVGLARIDKENPLIIFFKHGHDEKLFKHRAVVYGELRNSLKSNGLKKEIKMLLEHVLYQMETFYAQVCVPINFRDELLGVLLLGKKESGKNFSSGELNFFIALTSHVSMAIKNAQLFKQLEAEWEKKRQLFMRTTIALAAAIEAKDNYTHGHTNRVTSLSLLIAEKISQIYQEPFNDKFLEDLQVASLLHDIGKIGIPEYILNKEGSLTDDERVMIKEHPLRGVAILKSIKELEGSLLGVKYHHERYDGLGYPEGLRGEQIPMMASIISVADSFDAMITDRPYRHRLSKGDALEEMQYLVGKQFHLRPTNALVELCREDKV
jgi:HD-GYP domain-containing protein (c-di-GMP phosphodiesterase class II)